MNFRGLLLTLALVFMEWLDFSLYLYLAKSVFAVEFFSKDSQSLMLSFAVFAAAYLARPVGGWLFGRKADQSGRRSPMVFSAALIGLSTLGICFLPGYSVLGAWAAWGLLLFRIGQAMALGGEMNSSVFFVEHFEKRPLFAGSLIAVASALGMFFGGALAAIIQWLAWDGLWRAVFFLLGCFSLWICLLRKELEESPEFLNQSPGGNDRWQNYAAGIINIAAVAGFVSVSVYICNVFWVSFAIDQGLMSANVCAWTGAFAQLIAAFLALPIVFLSKEKQVYALMKTSMLSMAIVAPVLFYSTVHGLLVYALLSVLGYAIADSLLCASLFYLLYLQLPVQFRCRGVSFMWGLAASVGAIALPFAQKAVYTGHFWLPPAFVTLMSLSSFFILQRSRFKTAGLYSNIMEI